MWNHQIHQQIGFTFHGHYNLSKEARSTCCQNLHPRTQKNSGRIPLKDVRKRNMFVWCLTAQVWFGQQVASTHVILEYLVTLPFWQMLTSLTRGNRKRNQWARFAKLRINCDSSSDPIKHPDFTSLGQTSKNSSKIVEAFPVQRVATWLNCPCCFWCRKWDKCARGLMHCFQNTPPEWVFQALFCPFFPSGQFLRIGFWFFNSQFINGYWLGILRLFLRFPLW